MARWKPIKPHPNYEVSDAGKVRNRTTGRILKPCFSTGYAHVTLCDSSGHHQYGVHRLVASEFVSNPSGGDRVNHIDGNKRNNNASNLEWCDQSHNMRHAYATGLQKPIRAQIEASLSKAQKTHETPVRNIESGVVYPTVKDCAKAEGMSHSAISFHITGKAKNPRFEYV